MTKRNIVHIEIPTRNHEESIKFYHELFDWKTEHFPDMHYTTWEADEHPGGGFSEGSQPGEILIHINSDDIQADLKKAWRHHCAGENGNPQYRMVGRFQRPDR